MSAQSTLPTPSTLLDKLWALHVVEEQDGGNSLLYVDRHLIYEVTSPQAFEGLRLAGRKAWRANSVLATVDHNVSTQAAHRDLNSPGIDPMARAQIAQLNTNCKDFGIVEFGLSDRRQGIIHVIGPEQGATLPGMTVVAGDSHTSTHGAFGALAFGIGTSEVEHVLATQCLSIAKPQSMQIRVNGELPFGVTAKDLALLVITTIGAGGGNGYAIEFTGPVIQALSMEGRMTLCNMAIESGARVGLIAVDDVTIDYLKGRPYAPTGEDWSRAVAQWRALQSDAEADYDRTVELSANRLVPMVSWGTTPAMTVPVSGRIPDPALLHTHPVLQESQQRALDYMGLKAGDAIVDIQLDKIFIGSCTNARIEDLRSAASVIQGRQIAPTIRQALVVPGSGLVKQQAEAEGLDQLFIAAGFEWREPGCSMCLGMNDDRLNPQERCASTSNRNFEGRQGQGGRTHLVSPAMAVAAAIAGHFVDVRDEVTR